VAGLVIALAGDGTADYVAEKDWFAVVVEKASHRSTDAAHVGVRQASEAVLAATEPVAVMADSIAAVVTGKLRLASAVDGVAGCYKMWQVVILTTGRKFYNAAVVPALARFDDTAVAALSAAAAPAGGAADSVQDNKQAEVV